MSATVYHIPVFSSFSTRKTRGSWMVGCRCYTHIMSASICSNAHIITRICRHHGESRIVYSSTFFGPLTQKGFSGARSESAWLDQGSCIGRVGARKEGPCTGSAVRTALVISRTEAPGAPFSVLATRLGSFPTTNGSFSTTTNRREPAFPCHQVLSLELCATWHVPEGP